MHYIAHKEVNMCCLWCPHTCTHADTQLRRLIMRGWMLHQQPIITWGESVGLSQLAATLLSSTPPPKSATHQPPANWVRSQKTYYQIHSDNKSGMAVINSNLSRRMRDEGCSLVRELQHTERRVQGHERNERCVDTSVMQGKSTVFLLMAAG